MSGLNFEQNGVKYYIPALDGTEIFNDGVAKGKEECVKKHYVGFIEGSGSESLTFPCPFEPDTVLIYNFSELASTEVERPVGVFLFNRTSTGSCGAVSYSYKRSTDKMTDPISYMASGGASRYERNAADGTVTIKNIQNGGDTSTYNIFDAKLTYTVICEKHSA